MANRIETLTKEQEALCDRVAEEYEHLLDNPRDATLEADGPIVRWVNRVYEMYTLPPAPVELCLSPAAAFKREAELRDDKKSERRLDWSGLRDAGWVAFYDFWHRVQALTDDEAKDVRMLREYMRAGAFDSVFLGASAGEKEGRALVVVQPKFFKRDINGDLHCKDGPAVEWRDGEKLFYWHGVQVSERLIMQPETYTKAEYLAETNTETRRALSERLGWGNVMELLGAKLDDQWKDEKTGLSYALFSVEGLTEKLLRKESPVLQTGSQPMYMEPVHEDLRTAQAARKWQAVHGMTPEECERDPVLEYGVET